jgi:hypothetical protein
MQLFRIEQLDCSEVHTVFSALLLFYEASVKVRITLYIVRVAANMKSHYIDYVSR